MDEPSGGPPNGPEVVPWPYGAVGGHQTDLKQLLLTPPPPVVWAVDRLIPETSLTSFNGEGATGKSYVLMQLGLHLAAGTPVFGRFAVRRPYNILYIDLEMPEWATDTRFYRLLRGMRFDPEDVPPGMHVIPAASLLFDDALSAVQLERMVADWHIDFVMIDSFRRCYTGDGMKSEVINKVFRVMTAIRAKHKVGFISIDHWRKPKAEPGMNDIRHRLTESADKRNILDVNIAVEKAAADDDVLVITPEKDRHGDGSGEQFKIRFVHDDALDDNGPFRLDYVTAARSPLAVAIIDALMLAPGQRATIAELVQWTKSKNKSVQRSLQELDRDNVLIRKRIGNAWHVEFHPNYSTGQNAVQ